MEGKVSSFGQFKGYIPMPLRKTGYINFRNNDGDSFKYCVCASLFLRNLVQENYIRPKFHKRKPQNYFTWKRFFGKINWTPIANGLDNLDEFESVNSLRVNVFSHKDDKSLILLRKAKAAKGNEFICF